MPLLLLLLAGPLIEIMLFIWVGGEIGVWATLAIVILSTLSGAYILRHHSLSSLREVQTRLATGDDAAPAMADGAMLMIAGVLLFLPGLLTTATGLALLLPPVRRWLFTVMAPWMAVTTVRVGPAARGARGGDIVDGEFERVDPDEEPEADREHAGAPQNGEVAGRNRLPGDERR